MVDFKVGFGWVRLGSVGFGWVRLGNAKLDFTYGRHDTEDKDVSGLNGDAHATGGQFQADTKGDDKLVRR